MSRTSTCAVQPKANQDRLAAGPNTPEAGPRAVHKRPLSRLAPPVVQPRTLHSRPMTTVITPAAQAHASQNRCMSRVTTPVDESPRLQSRSASIASPSVQPQTPQIRSTTPVTNPAIQVQAAQSQYKAIASTLVTLPRAFQRFSVPETNAPTTRTQGSQFQPMNTSRTLAVEPPASEDQAAGVMSSTAIASNSSHQTRVKFTPEEDARLIHMREQGYTYTKMEQKFPGRTRKSLQQRGILIGSSKRERGRAPD